MGELTQISKSIGKIMEGVGVIDWEEEFIKCKEHIEESFKTNVKIKRKGGRVGYNCKKGLFGVSGPDNDETRREAMNYFSQYFEDGEYDQ